MFVGNLDSESATLISVLSLDEKSRVLLDKNIREVSGLKKGSKLVAIPFKGGVTFVDVTGKSFFGSRPRYAYDEEQHEASKFLFHKPQIIVNTGNEMTSRKTLTVSPSTFHLFAEIETNLGIDYFDAGVASESLQKNCIVVSTDQVFDTIPNLKRIW